MEEGLPKLVTKKRAQYMKPLVTLVTTELTWKPVYGIIDVYSQSTKVHGTCEYIGDEETSQHDPPTVPVGRACGKIVPTSGEEPCHDGKSAWEDGRRDASRVVAPYDRFYQFLPVTTPRE